MKTSTTFVVKVELNFKTVDFFQKVYGYNPPKKPLVYKWILCFTMGQDNGENETHSSTLPTFICKEKINIVHACNEEDQRLITETTGHTVDTSTGST